jgi:outer membrane biosynthesis protein TonB
MYHFELVETPSSAAVPTPPEKATLMSDKNARAQDAFQSDKKLKNSPHMEGKNPESKDTRPKMIVPQPPAPPAPANPQKKASPQEKMAKKETPQKDSERKPKEAAVDASTQVKLSKSPEPDFLKPESLQKEVIQLAKKPADASASIPPAAPAPSRVVTAASSRNADADAQITGELSFGASHHFFGQYLLKMKQAVERQWLSRLVTSYTGIVSSKAVIDFKIQPDGRVTDLAVQSSEGDPYFPLVCVSSINDAQPFDKIPYSESRGLPDRFMGKPLNIRFTFQYN